MSISEHDNRIQLPPTEVDFDDVVGITGQAHDDFPAAGQARYDTMRSYLIGLLSCQSSEDPPTQYRTGTLWFNRDKRAYYVWDGVNWTSLASFIAVQETSGDITSLADWSTAAQVKLDTVQPQITFSGRSVVDSSTTIPVPNAVQTAIADIFELLSPIVYINGLLIDPRSSRFSVGCPTSILLLNDVNLDIGDRFTVIIERFDMAVSDDIIVSS